MRIINLGYPLKNNVQFKSVSREYYDPKLESKNETLGFVSTYTKPCREDLYWAQYIQDIDKNFADKDEINIFDLACSDGSEAYTLKIAIDNFASNPEKYKSIIATDRDSEIIKAATNRRINLTIQDLRNIKKLAHKTTQDYFENESAAIRILGERAPLSYKSYTPNDSLRNFVTFKQEDILTTLENMQDSGNSLVLCRNVAPYLSIEYQEKIYETALKMLKPGSVITFGSFDFYTLMAKLFRKSDKFLRICSYTYKKL